MHGGETCSWRLMREGFEVVVGQGSRPGEVGEGELYLVRLSEAT